MTFLVTISKKLVLVTTFAHNLVSNDLLCIAKIVNAECNVFELLELAWGREIDSSLILINIQVEGNDVDDQPTPIVKLPQARE